MVDFYFGDKITLPKTAPSLIYTRLSIIGQNIADYNAQ